MFLDQDGVRTHRGAGDAATLPAPVPGTGWSGRVCVGRLLPDVAAKLQTIIDACLSPKTAPAFLSIEEAMAAGRDADPRTRDQQRHDVFAGIVDTAARALDMPQLGGAAPVVAVAVTAENLESGTGCGFIGETPISMAAVRQFACTGGMQKIVFDQDGRILELGSRERIFTAQQRRAIILRDGQCCTPGCNMPGVLSEIHHVDPAGNGGPTHTDNGMVLCWFHHRMLDTSGWEFRMVNGLPEVKYPPWLDDSGNLVPHRTIRHPPTSPSQPKTTTRVTS